MPTQKTVVDQSYVFKPGERGEFEYAIVGGNVYFQAVQIGMIESRLEKIPGLQYLGHSMPPVGENRIIFKVKAIEQPNDGGPVVHQAGVSAIIIVAAITGIAIFTWLSLREIRLVSTVTDGPVIGNPITDMAGSAKAGFTMVTVLILAGVGWYVYRALKSK